jgi:hypothetical protein
VLNCTWDDVEAASVILKLELSLKEREKLHSYLKLREQYRKSSQSSASSDPEQNAE